MEERAELVQRGGGTEEGTVVDLGVWASAATLAAGPFDPSTCSRGAKAALVGTHAPPTPAKIGW
jgi:hypothetical protein